MAKLQNNIYSSRTWLPIASFKYKLKYLGEGSVHQWGIKWSLPSLGSHGDSATTCEGSSNYKKQLPVNTRQFPISDNKLQWEIRTPTAKRQCFHLHDIARKCHVHKASPRKSTFDKYLLTGASESLCSRVLISKHTVDEYPHIHTYLPTGSKSL